MQGEMTATKEGIYTILFWA